MCVCLWGVSVGGCVWRGGRGVSPSLVTYFPLLLGLNWDWFTCEQLYLSTYVDICLLGNLSTHKEVGEWLGLLVSSFLSICLLTQRGSERGRLSWTGGHRS